MQIVMFETQENTVLPSGGLVRCISHQFKPDIEINFKQEKCIRKTAYDRILKGITTSAGVGVGAKIDKRGEAIG